VLGCICKFSIDMLAEWCNNALPNVDDELGVSKPKTPEPVMKCVTESDQSPTSRAMQRTPSCSAASNLAILEETSTAGTPETHSSSKSLAQSFERATIARGLPQPRDEASDDDEERSADDEVDHACTFASIPPPAFAVSTRDFVDAAVINGTSHRVERLPHALLLLHARDAVPSPDGGDSMSTSTDTVLPSPGALAASLCHVHMTPDRVCTLVCVNGTLHVWRTAKAAEHRDRTVVRLLQITPNEVSTEWT